MVQTPSNKIILKCFQMGRNKESSTPFVTQTLSSFIRFLSEYWSVMFRSLNFHEVGTFFTWWTNSVSVFLIQFLIQSALLAWRNTKSHWSDTDIDFIDIHLFILYFSLSETLSYRQLLLTTKVFYFKLNQQFQLKNGNNFAEPYFILYFNVLCFLLIYCFVLQLCFIIIFDLLDILYIAFMLQWTKDTFPLWQIVKLYCSLCTWYLCDCQIFISQKD